MANINNVNPSDEDIATFRAVYPLMKVDFHMKNVVPICNDKATYVPIFVITNNFTNNYIRREVTEKSTLGDLLETIIEDQGEDSTMGRIILGFCHHKLNSLNHIDSIIKQSFIRQFMSDEKEKIREKNLYQGIKNSVKKHKMNSDEVTFMVQIKIYKSKKKWYNSNWKSSNWISHQLENDSENDGGSDIETPRV